MISRSPRHVVIQISLAGALALATGHRPSIAQPDAPAGQLQLPGAVTEPPEWIGANLPFDQQDYLQAPPPEENAAPLYLEALFEFDMLYFSEPVGEEQIKAAKALRARASRLQQLHNAYEEDPGSGDNGALQELLAEYRRGFEQLKAAQQRPDCVFQMDIGVLALLPHARVAAHEVANYLELRTHRDLREGRIEGATENVRMLLRLARDLRPRGSAVCQLASLQMERSCFDGLVSPILAHDGLHPRHCDDLLNAILESEGLENGGSRNIDPLIETARFEHLKWRRLLYEVEHGKLDERAQELDFNAATQGVTLLTFLTDLDEHEINTHFVRRLVAELARRSERAAELLATMEQTPEARAELDRVGAGILLELAVQEMGPEEYDREITVLNRRYEQMATAGRLPYPQRVARFGAFGSQWTNDDSWKETRILRLFHPPPMHRLAERVRDAELRRNAFKCIIAVARWQIEQASPPDDLLAAVKACGLERVPLDPYTGQPLRMAKGDGRLVIYSVGPDATDNGGDPIGEQSGPEKSASRGDLAFAVALPPAETDLPVHE